MLYSRGVMVDFASAARMGNRGDNSETQEPCELWRTNSGDRI